MAGQTAIMPGGRGRVTQYFRIFAPDFPTTHTLTRKNDMGRHTTHFAGQTLLWLLLITGLAIRTATGLAAEETYDIRGQVVDRASRQPIAYATVALFGYPDIGTRTDSTGVFCLHRIPPGIHRLTVSCIGYKSLLTPEYVVSAKLPFIELELEEDASVLAEVTVEASSIQRIKSNPVSLQIIGLSEIEKSPGGNRDISRIVRSYPGVAFSPIGYRNDLIVRGGSPSENRFFMDGIEIPNINHFATQGASGGPVSILNADLIREVQFYTGAFPVDKAGALSSVMDIRLQDGDLDGNSFKATLGASEVSLSGSGHLGEKTTYLFSARQSYLQLLFKMLGLPFLPNYIDGQFKVKTRFNAHNELTVLGLTGIDNMKLNIDEKGEDAEYLLSYLPRIKQQTFTLGAAYRHYGGKHVQTVSVGYNYLGNQNLKYRGNDSSNPSNLILDLNSREQKLTLRAENRTYAESWTWKQGAEAYHARYYDHTFQRLYGSEGATVSNYRTNIGIWGWAAYASAGYRTADERFAANLGLRLDGSAYSRATARFWQNLSPNASLSYRFRPHWAVNAGAGLYHQLPAYTSLGYKTTNGTLANKNLRYQRVANANVGIEWNHNERVVVSLEGFYKRYTRMPLSVADGIPLACKGNDYGTVGNELLVATAQGRAYGVEASMRWQIPGKLTSVASVTLFRSEYRDDGHSPYVASAWDNRFIANASATYELPRHWSIGAKLSAIGGAPYTPYDVDKSSLVQAWDAQGRPYYDYSRYNTERLDAFAQLDVRVDKNFYFKGWMLGIYLDLQNITKSVLKQPDVLMSTGIVDNPEAPAEQQRYRMKYIKQESGSLIPGIGLTALF